MGESVKTHSKTYKVPRTLSAIFQLKVAEMKAGLSYPVIQPVPDAEMVVAGSLATIPGFAAAQNGWKTVDYSAAPITLQPGKYWICAEIIDGGTDSYNWKGEKDTAYTAGIAAQHNADKWTPVPEKDVFHKIHYSTATEPNGVFEFVDTPAADISMVVSNLNKVAQSFTVTEATTVSSLELFLEDNDPAVTQDLKVKIMQVSSSYKGPASLRKKLEFAYDSMGRRKLKQSYYRKEDGSWQLDYTRKFIYDGWNLICELDENNNTVRKYVWGKDLSGSRQGVGGVGGLLVITDKDNHSFYPAYDGNGNIRALVGTDGALKAEYDYTPYGKPSISKASDPIAGANPFRFSTKYTDSETGLLYYGFRYYDPSTCKWLNRDPIGEAGGLNLYAFCGNDPVNGVDLLGMKAYLVYRKLMIPLIDKTHKMTGHVYLAFDNKGKDGKESSELVAFFKGAAAKPIELKSNPLGGYHTFSFHPWSVRHTDETSGNRLSVVVTDTSDVYYQDKKNDVRPILDNSATKWVITDNPKKQLDLMEKVILSWKINSSSADSNDDGHYSFVKNNCGTWATRMIKRAGLKVPGGAMNFGTGLGYGFDKTGIPQTIYYLGRGWVDAKDAKDKKPMIPPEFSTPQQNILDKLKSWNPLRKPSYLDDTYL